MIENHQAKLLWDFKIHYNKVVVANQPDIVGVGKQEKMAVVTDIKIPSYSNIVKKEHKKLASLEVMASIKSNSCYLLIF